MLAKEVKEIRTKICRELKNFDYPNKTQSIYSMIDRFINSDELINNLEYIIEKSDFSARKTIEMSISFLEDISGDYKICNCDAEDKVDQYMKYLYNFALAKNFKKAVMVDLNHSFDAVCEVFYLIFQIICQYERKLDNFSMRGIYPLEFLTEGEISELENDEYIRFEKVFKKNYVYEMIKLSDEIFGFNTLDHICGVHYLALKLARQLKKKGILVDLGRVSGAAAGHDIGKYGCKGEELKRVPHLHYYYTDVWFKNNGINYIRNIAINHSTWDLEIENLSLESLILIYCDFRVKNKGKDMTIFSLEDSFRVILDKLENVDSKKEKRYKRVYAKLVDFEDYMIRLGVDIRVNTYVDYDEIDIPEKSFYSLLFGDDITEEMKYLAIEHNIKLMYHLRDEFTLENMLDQARTEKQWKNLRQYIRVLREYSTYFTPKQKLQTIKFLYENLYHIEDDIRRHSAELIGILIASYDEEYKKELPKDVAVNWKLKNSCSVFKNYLSLCLFPNVKIIPTHRAWIGYSSKIMVNALFKNCRRESRKRYREILMQYYNVDPESDIKMSIYLLEIAKVIPFSETDSEMDSLFYFLIGASVSKDFDLRVLALEVIGTTINKLPRSHYFAQTIKKYLQQYESYETPIERYAIYKINKYLRSSGDKKNNLNFEELNAVDINNIFLSNLKTDTSWIRKKIQIDILVNQALNFDIGSRLHTCLHFCNVLKVSEMESVRNKAGASILKIINLLKPTERNEIAVELLRGLEIEGQKFTEYIPRFLAGSLLWLEPLELDAILDDLKINIKSANDDIKILILKTIGITLGDYKKYENRFKEENDEDYSNRLIDMLSILLNGLGNYKSRVKQAAIITIGKDIFASSTLSLKDKHNIFVLLAKKILTLTTEDRDDFLMFMTNSAAINHIYRFIADYTFFVGKINIDVPKQIAFFPGTFDPFSITHKNISKIIRDLGFEVYLAVDEFSWSKKTLPNLLRQNIINLSICDELNIYIYPEYFQTNISNENDLKILRENFKDSSLYFVSGGDVLLNASCYENKSTEDSIHSFNHIIFDRGNTEKLKERTNLIKGDVKIIMIPEKYSSVSSTQIRNYIDNSRDISDLTDPLVKQYIYEKGFYQREPMEKKSLLFEGLLFETIDGRDMIKIRELLDKFDLNGRIQNHLITSDNKEESKIIVIKNNNYSEIMAISCIHWVKNKSVFEDFKDEKVCKYIRENSSGRIISIDFIEINNNYNSETVSNTIATEVISYALSQDYEFAVYQCLNDSKNFEVITKTLKLLGFVEVDSLDKDRTTFAVDMSSPSMINLDVENVIKEPFRANKNVLKTIEKAREELQKLWISIFPGQLFITFDSNILHQKMINMICAENGVPIDKVLPPKERGPYMCVPFGDSLDRYVVPNTVTKSLHVDKYFSGDIKSFFIAEAPYYLTLKNQVRMIKSFDRDLILVDDFLHKGARLKKLDPILKEENITVKKLIVGILTGIGKDLMDTQGREIDSVYFLPKLKLWFNERVLYPFIGGDPVWRGKSPKRNLIESNNMILPYTFPTFMKDLDKKDVYQFSKVCLENSYEILKSLELEYHKIYGRNLTLETLGEVITNPRIPEFGEEIYYNLSLTPTSYVMKDLELLSRFKIMR